MESRQGFVVGNIPMNSPVILESGPFAHDGDAIIRAGRYGYGAVSTETITSRDGKSPQWHLKTSGTSLINCSRWSDIPIDGWLCNEIPKALQASCKTILSLGHGLEEVKVLLEAFKDSGVAGFKMVSYTPDELAQMVAYAKQKTGKPVWAKISPNWENMVTVADDCLRAGADALVAIDTFGPVAVLPDQEAVPFARSRAWLSGEALHALALKSVETLHRRCNIDIIGTGGIHDPASLYRMKQAGAAGFGVCTAVILHGLSIIDILDWEAIMEEGEAQSESSLSYGPLSLDLDRRRCTNCMRCVDICGYRGWVKKDERILRGAGCRGCGLCIQFCPEGAIVNSP